MSSDEHSSYGNNKYSQVPPPSELSSSDAVPAAAPVDFSDALQKARAIAEKLKQASGSSAPAPAPASDSPSAGSKRSHYDDHDTNDATSSSSSKYDSYESSKRAAYDTGSSQPSYMPRNEPRRYGLGSEERSRYQRHESSYGGSNGPSSGGGRDSGSIKVPNRMVGIIIGRGGDNLKKVERYSGARIQIDQDSGDSERNITLTGEEVQIQMAKDMIQQMVRDANDSAANGGHGGDGGNDNDVRLKLSVPSNKVGLVIGRGGETIRDLEDRSGAKIKVLTESPGDRSSVRTVSIVGDKHSTEKAKTLVEDIINNNNDQNQGYHNEQRPHDGGGGYGGRSDGGAMDTVRIPKEFVGLIIGRGGETVRALQDESGARIVIDKYGDPHADQKTLTLHGTPETIAIAKNLIMEKVESGQNAREGHGSSGGYRGGRGGMRGGYGRVGGGGSYRNDYYGGNDDYQQQQQQPQQDAAYDYSQYQSYYGQQQQYGGYDQYNPQQANDGYYNNNYGGSANETTTDQGTAPSDDKKDDKESSSSTAAPNDAYYGQQYYGQQPSDQQQWTQEAYNQYYQQYYTNAGGSGGEGYQGDQQQEEYKPEGGGDDATEK